MARALHYNGPRRGASFQSVNCAALPENLLESELFGVVRGAYTGADRDRKDLLVAARGGTLFLDEVGEMSLAMQAKLLRVLQERRVRPVGSNQEIEVDLRLVCATNRRLREEVAAGRFREDLYYRIAVVEIALPPLRERREDIPNLCSHFLAQAAAAMGRNPMLLGADALREIMRHPLPGNVRQLDNLLRRACVIAAGPRIRAVDLDLAVPRASQPPKTSLPANRESFRQEESRRILQALQEHNWNVSAAARSLGIPRNSTESFARIESTALHDVASSKLRDAFAATRPSRTCALEQPRQKPKGSCTRRSPRQSIRPPAILCLSWWG